MEQQSIKITIDKKGRARIELNGFHGVGCTEIAEKLKAIGRVTSETNKPEFYENNENASTLDNLA